MEEFKYFVISQFQGVQRIYQKTIHTKNNNFEDRFKELLCPP